MTSIQFNRTSNVFLNTGIIALHHYLKMCSEDDSYLGYPIHQSNFELDKDKLTINYDNLFQLLEDVYYLMGKEVYDLQQQDGNKKYYFVREPFSYTEFTTMNSYGLSGLLSKPPLGPQPTSKNESDWATFDDLYNSDFEFAKKIADVYFEKKVALKGFDVLEDKFFPNVTQVKGDSKIFLNQEYTKTPRIDIENAYFQTGNEVCCLTGEKFKKLCFLTSTSVFFSDIKNFNSFLKPDKQRAISWKAMYLSRFSPKYCLYMYVSGLESIVCYLFESGNLEQLKQLYDENRSIFKSKLELLDASYMSNFKFHNFNYKKDNENKLTLKGDYTEQAEISFMLIYTIYRQILFNQGINEITDKEDDFDPMAESSFKKLPASLVSFRADKFASTLRPNGFEYFNNFKYAIRLISYLERNGVNFQQALSSLKFLNPSGKNSKNKERLKRQIRNRVLNKILKQKSILADIEILFYRCFTLLVSAKVEELKSDNLRFKNYPILQKLVELYEPIIYSKDNNLMKEETDKIQEKAIKFGSSIGLSIINYDEPKNLEDKQINAKNGRKIIIGLHKARTISHLRDVIIRIQKKYGLVLSSDLQEGMNEANFEMVKQLAVISALNIINSTLK